MYKSEKKVLRKQYCTPVYRPFLVNIPISCTC